MDDNLVPIYRALTVDDAQRLADTLTEKGVEAFTDTTENPLLGASVGPSGRIVRVRARMLAPAREIAEQYRREWHPDVPAEQWHYEEAGLEVHHPDKPSRDSPHEDIGGGVEAIDEAPQAPPPELPETPRDDPVKGIGADRAPDHPPPEEEIAAEEPPDERAR